MRERIGGSRILAVDVVEVGEDGAGILALGVEVAAAQGGDAARIQVVVGPDAEDVVGLQAFHDGLEGAEVVGAFRGVAVDGDARIFAGDLVAAVGAVVVDDDELVGALAGGGFDGAAERGGAVPDGHEDGDVHCGRKVWLPTWPRRTPWWT